MKLINSSLLILDWLTIVKQGSLNGDELRGRFSSLLTRMKRPRGNHWEDHHLRDKLRFHDMLIGCWLKKPFLFVLVISIARPGILERGLPLRIDFSVFKKGGELKRRPMVRTCVLWLNRQRLRLSHHCTINSSIFKTLSKSLRYTNGRNPLRRVIKIRATFVRCLAGMRVILDNSVLRWLKMSSYIRNTFFIAFHIFIISHFYRYTVKHFRCLIAGTRVRYAYIVRLPLHAVYKIRIYIPTLLFLYTWTVEQHVSVRLWDWT
jgi:hypothetical protein